MNVYGFFFFILSNKDLRLWSDKTHLKIENFLISWAKVFKVLKSIGVF